MKEETDEKNNKAELKWELKKASEQMEEKEGETGMVLKDQEREETHRQKKEEMREIYEGETRDGEERKPDEGDSPHHGLKDR